MLQREHVLTLFGWVILSIVGTLISKVVVHHRYWHSILHRENGRLLCRWKLLGTKVRFRLRSRGASVKRFRWMEQYYWLRNGSSPAGVYTMVKTFPVENFKHGWNNGMVADMASLFFARVFFGGQVSRAASNLLPLENPNLRHFCIVLPSCPPY